MKFYNPKSRKSSRNNNSIHTKLFGFTSTNTIFHTFNYYSKKIISSIAVIRKTSVFTSGLEFTKTVFLSTPKSSSVVGLWLLETIVYLWFRKNQYTHFLFKGDRKGLFGLPGGRADPGEFISVATERELFE